MSDEMMACYRETLSRIDRQIEADVRERTRYCRDEEEFRRTAHDVKVAWMPIREGVVSSMIRLSNLRVDPHVVYSAEEA